MNSRTLAAKVLVAVIHDRQSLSQALPQIVGRDAQDSALIKELCFGVCRWHQRLQLLTGKMLERPLKARDTDIQALLMLGFYQLLYTRVPAHAAIHETVQASKELNKRWASGMLNGVLRRFGREREQILAELEQTPDFQYSHPAWILAHLQQAYPDQWPRICTANNDRAPLTLRINPNQVTRDAYLQQLGEQGIAAHATQFADSAIQLEQPMDVRQLPGFDSGVVSVQDEAAQLAAGLLDPEPGMRVLDACAAPGGKSCHLLEHQPGLKELVAVDISADRTALIHDNLQRGGLSATVVTGDAGTPSSWWDGKPFERILLDAPCSASGVIRRHPDIKLLRRQQDVAKLAHQQLELLKTLWPLLTPTGILLYATCSVFPEENEAVITRFLAEQDDAASLDIAAEWGEAGEFGRQLLPQPGGNDGFYYASIQKNG